ncbi:MAG: SufE family protein [Candidatus Methylacidiphilales bacterium]
MTAQERARELVDKMNRLPDSQERFLYVISCGKRAPGLPEDLKVDAFRIEGCQSALWMVPEFTDGLCHYRSDSDAFITKGVSSIVCSVYSGSTPEEVLALDEAFLREAGITEHLTPNRANGLSQLLKKVKGFASLHCPSPPAPSGKP